MEEGINPCRILLFRFLPEEAGSPKPVAFGDPGA
jgi:hypothetical protein